MSVTTNNTNGEKLRNAGSINDIEDDDTDKWDDANDRFVDEEDLFKTADSPSADATNDNSTLSFQQKQHIKNCKSTKIQDENNSSCHDLRLHEAIFKNDKKQIYDILIDKELSTQLVNTKDKHGNTPLHLACMMGRSKNVISYLLKRGASVECKNVNRWTPFHEACSYGDREIITLMTIQLGNAFHESLNHQKLAKQLKKQKDYRVVLKWEFRSWVPFLARVLPNDICIINKQGGNIRIDTRLVEVGPEMMSWKRTDGCLIYSSDSRKKWIVMNKKSKKYQHISFSSQGLNRNIDSKVDDFMSADIIDIELKSSDIVLTRSKSGWIWKAEKEERIGNFDAALYEFDNVFLVTRKRREHLSEEDVRRNKMSNKSAMDMLRFGRKTNDETTDGPGDNDDQDDRDSDDKSSEDVHQHRPSLPPPPPTNVTWEEYLSSAPGLHPNLGREQKIKITKTPFKAGLAVSNQFPLTKEEFIDLLSIVPLKLFEKLKDFIQVRLPDDGFPIRVDVPIFSFLAARITLEDFEFLTGPKDDSLFKIPDDFEAQTESMLPIFRKYKEKDVPDEAEDTTQPPS